MVITKIGVSVLLVVSLRPLLLIILQHLETWGDIRKIYKRKLDVLIISLTIKQVLRLAINKLGTDGGVLTRVLTTRAEVTCNASKKNTTRGTPFIWTMQLSRTLPGTMRSFLWN
ncbi:hypothetical protein DVH24_039297 [Malus domestica]|uniref:Uncharacterized protein n=1 Tax=Malus domestica TaxID=3750 RepID=A0A498HVI4_MALDO|nr:hypothetical protein DVH24_039297 [Malus domestica]